MIYLSVLSMMLSLAVFLLVGAPLEPSPLLGVLFVWTLFISIVAAYFVIDLTKGYDYVFNTAILVFSFMIMFGFAVLVSIISGVNLIGYFSQNATMGYYSIFLINTLVLYVVPVSFNILKI